MSQGKNARDKFTEQLVVAAATAVVGVGTAIVGRVLQHRIHEPGVQKTMFCVKEDKLTTHVAVSLSDAEMRNGEVEESNQQKIIKTLKRANPLSRKPYMCQNCGNLKWV